MNSKPFQHIKVTLFIFFVWVCIPIYSQKNNQKFTKINIELDGETVFDVSVITQDHQGYMWFETNLGLIKYDGFKARKYDLRKPRYNSFSDDYIMSLMVDSQGILWVGANSGLSNYDQVCDCFYHFPEVINNHSLTQISAISEDKNKNIWIGTNNGNLFKYNRSDETFTRFLHNLPNKEIIKDRIGALLVDKLNNLWIGTDSGLIRYNIAIEQIDFYIHDPFSDNSIIDNRIRAVYEDQKGQILIGTANSGLHVYHPENDVVKR